MDHRPRTRLDVGVMLNSLGRDRLAALQKAAELGFRHVHTGALPEAWLGGPERDRYVSAVRASGLTVGGMFVGFDGQSYADRDSIRRTVGLVRPETRDHRTWVALQYVELARELGVPALAAHLGFLLEDPRHPDFRGVVESVRRIADECADRGQAFLLETGQEPADALLRFLHEVDRPNVGVNFDPANFVIYDTDEPLAALDKLAPYVRGVHCKDAVRPERPDALGLEAPLGHGQVDVPAFVCRVQGLGYRGPLVIEREQTDRGAEEVIQARDYLAGLLAE